MKELINALWQIREEASEEPSTISPSTVAYGKFLLIGTFQALANVTRLKILVFLRQNRQRRPSFEEIRQAVGLTKKALLARHLQVLQRVSLISRYGELGSSRTLKDPYHAFYQISKYGLKALRLAVSMLSFLNDKREKE